MTDYDKSYGDGLLLIDSCIESKNEYGNQKSPEA
jgi:hypothetical protein